MKTSGLFSLDWRDLVKGLFTAIGGAIVAVVMNDVNAGNFKINGVAIWHGAIIGGIGYLAKNFFSPPQVVTNPNPTAAIPPPINTTP